MRKVTSEERRTRWRNLSLRRKRVDASRAIAEASGITDESPLARSMMYRPTNGIIRPGYFGVVNYKALGLLIQLPASLILAMIGQPGCLSRWSRLAADLPRYYAKAFQGHRAWRKWMRELINSRDGTIPD